MDRPIYLDYNATTPVDPAVLEAMMPYLREFYGNASSMSHAFGWEASQAVENARKLVAKTIGAKPAAIYWTSGATESNNLALQGVLRPYIRRQERAHLITTLVEHKAVLDVAKALEEEGVEVTYLKPDQTGRISPESVEKAIQPHTRLISVIMGQNEIGTINPIKDIGRIAKKHGVLFHSDCAQSVGRVSIDVDDLNLDFLSASGHKIYAPKGIGFLFVSTNNRDLKIGPILHGGSQEKGLRPGTLNVPGIVALGKACELCMNSMEKEVKRLCDMRDTFIRKVREHAPTVRLNGHTTERLCSNISFSFCDLDPECFALGLSGLAVSSGSACTTGSVSHVLEAIGMPTGQQCTTVRFGIGRFTTSKDLEVAAQKIIDMVEKYQ